MKMKKLNYLMLGLAGLTLASCSQDDLQAPNQVEGNYVVTVKLPGNLGTRAVNMNTGYTANDLYYAVYDAADGSLVQQAQTVFTEADGGALETQVGLNLAHGKSYKISFFACAPKNDVYTFDAEAGQLKVDYSAMTSEGTEENDIYDCFINLLETKEIGSDEMQASLTLYRPIAQINWGTSDLDEPSIEKAYGENGQFILSNLTTDAYDTWDLLTNDVDVATTSPVPVKYQEYFTQPQNENGLAAFPVNPNEYKYVAMQYVLAPREAEAIYDLKLNITNGGEGNTDMTELSTDVQVSAAPVQANFQTNIYGSLLTDNVIVDVVKSPGWTTPGYNVENTNDFVDALAQGGTVTLFGDVYLPSTATISNNTIIDLNGHNIYWMKPKDGGILVGQGGNLTIKGNGNVIDYYPEDNYQTLVFVQGGTLNIEGGNFTGYGAGQLIYVESGVANISGGNFALLEDTSGDNWCLNCKDANYKNGTAKINVTGGTFLNWNPGANNAEGANTNYVAQGYKVVPTSDGDNTYYTVVSDGTVVTGSFEDAVQASKNGENVFLTGNVSGDGTTGGYGNNLGGLVVNGTTVNGNGYTFDVINESGRTNDYIIYTSGGIIENITLTSSDNSGFKGILGEGFSYDLTLNNVKINPDANVAYAFNFSVGNGKTVNATNCTFCGWSSWGTGFKQLNFNNCYWGIGTYYSGSYAVLNGVVKPYATTVFENCQFDEWIYMDLSELAADATITFKNCTVNGVVLTKANHTIMKGYTLDDLSDWENYEKVADRIIFN